MIRSICIRIFVVLGFFSLGLYLMLLGAIWLGIVLHIILFTYLLWGTLNPSSRLFGQVIRTTERNDLWLTIDDGPDPIDTPKILDLLDEYQAKATFFVIGNKAHKHPELVKEIIQRGHEIGNHTWNHPQSNFWCLGPRRTYKEILLCQLFLEKLLQRPVPYFRAPVGHYNLFVHPVLKQLNLTLIGWSSRGYDGVDANLDNVFSRIAQTMKPGSIVLIHESTPIAIDLTKKILIHAKTQKWQFKIPAESQR